MNGSASQSLRDNTPLYVVLAVLVISFAALAAFGRGAEAPPAAEQQAKAPTAAIAQLPATAEDDNTVLSILDPEAARVRNATVPFADASLAPAPTFLFRGSDEDRLRARECLALAAMAEAGAGDSDQRAVMQVILNRVRHPAFAKTICGVVFEGSQRPTGCQFTFTCDGSLNRSYPQSLWQAARQRADDALVGGYVHKPVGTATHYHADYVYPYWSGELDKIAAIGPHLFFRWKGSWGGTQALAARYTGGEPDPAALEQLAQSTQRPEDLLPRLAQQGTAVRSITAAQATEVRPGDQAPANPPGGATPRPGVHFVLVAASDAPDALIDRARALCPGDRYCQVYGWDDPAAIPTRLPLTDDARRRLRFSFLPARSGNAEVSYFDCRIFPQPASGTCLPRARP